MLVSGFDSTDFDLSGRLKSSRKKGKIQSSQKKVTESSQNLMETILEIKRMKIK